MAKLYVFGIGGTGSRVIRSFTYLLATGVKLQGFSEVVPIIIDADNSAGDKTDTVKLMNDYVKLYKQVDHTSAAFKDSFFSTMISSVCSKNFTLQIPGATSQKFKDYMSFNQLTVENKAFVSMLFSEDNLEADMSVGFKGNPNIGSIVLNQFVDSPDFIQFANGFQQGDAIFIISSIFGGTGASGFPILLKNLRSNNPNIPNGSIIAQSQIGAITILPYFSLEPQNDVDQIDGSTFIQKTRAALKYYERNLGDLDHLYYIGDDMRPEYKNHDGGNLQKNDPHFIEFASALSIFHFAQSSMGMEQTTVHTPVYHEYGIKQDLPQFNFSNIADQSRNFVIKPMTKFLLMHNFMNQALESSWTNAWAATHEPIFNPTVLSNGNFLENLKTFTKGYHEWLEKMASNKRSFAPFNLNTDGDNVFELISGIKPKKSGWFSDDNYGLFIKTLDTIKNPKKGNMNKAMLQISANWIDLFARTTDKLVKEKLNLI